MPSFLTPDFGLLFWMLLAFLIVLFILGKWGFPVIVNMVEERKKYIDNSLKSAREANERLANLKKESDSILKEAHAQESDILKDARQMRDNIINEAKKKATAESARIIEEAHQQIEADREKAKRQDRERVINLSVNIAGKVLAKDLEEDKKQAEWVSQLLDQVEENKQ